MAGLMRSMAAIRVFRATEHKNGAERAVDRA
jgi:hypothetical protein